MHTLNVSFNMKFGYLSVYRPKQNEKFTLPPDTLSSQLYNNLADADQYVTSMRLVDK